MEQTYCQSCAMPLKDHSDCGDNADGTINRDYCNFCYASGQFTQECTMEEMIETCSQYYEHFRDAEGNPVTKEQAVEMMTSFFPKLKRWKNEQ